MSTPVQRQYTELKSQNPDAILFFRLGDFYEMFFEDAQLCSRLLGIVLTARHRGTENEMPMCGFPHHAVATYLETLVSAGYRVAIAEQIEDPVTKKISRSIVRVVTPGTSLESGNLEPEKNNFLASIAREKDQFALAYSDLSTGDFRTALFENQISFLDELYKIAPREILIPGQLLADEKFCQLLPSSHFTPRKNFASASAGEILKTHFGVKSLNAFGIEKLSLLIEVSAQVLSYLQETQKTKLSHISSLVHYSPSRVMQLDAQTLQHLEIFEPLQNAEKGGTLWNVFERTGTALGARLLRAWMTSPLLDRDQISERHDAVEELTQNLEMSHALDEAFENIFDLERILSRIVTRRGSARDLALYRNSFSVFPSLREACGKSKSVLIREKAEIFSSFESLTQKLHSALVESPPVEITSGGMFQTGFSSELDELRELTKNSKQWLDHFLEQQKKETGISSLRIKFSHNFGFCLEVFNTHKNRVPAHWMRRQTLVNAERFTTPELSEYEEKVLSAEGKAFALEHQLFLQLCDEVLTFAPQIQQVAKAIAELDTLLTFAHTASKWRWTRPEISESSSVLHIERGRHPVVEKLSPEIFIANDLQMDSKSSRLHLLTGPNMGGKSTFLRQNALLILLAQMGSFVPAKKMILGIFDRIFTRVGASDNLAGGKSTFFVEMSETARILHLATPKSFVILDEIGRGTSTFDGISLAWAITEFLHDRVQCFTLFATHFHELIELVEGLPAAANFHVDASQSAEGIQFLRRVRPGGISDSFGIEVAKSAGMPTDVIKNARDVLRRLESENLLSGKPNLFTLAREHQSVSEMISPSMAEEMLESLRPEELTPRQALDILFEMKKKSAKQG